MVPDVSFDLILLQKVLLKKSRFFSCFKSLENMGYGTLILVVLFLQTILLRMTWHKFPRVFLI